MSMNVSKPSYRLITTLQTPRVDPGETVEISVYAVGYGNVTKSRLSATFPHPECLKHNSGRYIMNIGHLSDGENYSPAPGYIDVRDLNESYHMSMDVHALLWTELDVAEAADRIDGVFSDISEPNPPPHMYPALVFEGPWRLSPLSEQADGGQENPFSNDDRDKIETIGNTDKFPPLKIELETLEPEPLGAKISKILSNKSRSQEEKYCTPGDYDVTFTLSYGSENIVYQNQSTAQFHVNNWVERNVVALQVVAILLSSVIAISAIVSLLSAL